MNKSEPSVDSRISTAMAASRASFIGEFQVPDGELDVWWHGAAYGTVAILQVGATVSDMGLVETGLKLRRFMSQFNRAVHTAMMSQKDLPETFRKLAQGTLPPFRAIMLVKETASVPSRSKEALQKLGIDVMDTSGLLAPSNLEDWSRFTKPSTPPSPEQVT